MTGRPRVRAYHQWPRTLLGASAMTTLGTLPVFLLSSQSVYIREALGFDEVRFRAAVSVFFGRLQPLRFPAETSPTGWGGVPARDRGLVAASRGVGLAGRRTRGPS